MAVSVRSDAGAAAAGAAGALNQQRQRCASQRPLSVSTRVRCASPAPSRRSPARVGATGGSNLGELQRTVLSDGGRARTEEIDPYLQYRVTPESLANRDKYAVDGGTAALNVALLLLLVFLATERIFGLDKAIAGALRRWKESREEQRRYEANDARRELERRWQGEEGGGGGEEGGGSGRGGGRGSGGRGSGPV